MLPKALQQDRELLLLALVHGLLFRYCPRQFRTDLTFLVAVVNRKSEIYSAIDRTLQAVPEIALGAITSGDVTLAVYQRAMDSVPSLKSDRNHVLALSAQCNASFLIDFFAEADAVFKDDKEIMMTAVAREGMLFPYASARLREDSDMLAVTVGDTVAVIHSV
jgi:hypothetical protein